MDAIRSAQETFTSKYPAMRAYALRRIRHALANHSREELADWALGHAWRHWLYAVRDGLHPESFWVRIAERGVRRMFDDIDGATGARERKRKSTVALSAAVESVQAGRDARPDALAEDADTLATFQAGLTDLERMVLQGTLEGRTAEDLAPLCGTSKRTVERAKDAIRRKWVASHLKD